jgi:hypothetical protein
MLDRHTIEIAKKVKNFYHATSHSKVPVIVILKSHAKKN